MVNAVAAGGVEVVPGLWIGGNTTCDRLRQSMSFRCVNVGTKIHTNSSRCQHIPVAGSDGFVDYNAQAMIYSTIIGWWPQYGNVLLHFGNAMTYSPLSMALALQVRYQLSFAEAYRWVTKAQPGLQYLSKLVKPVATNTALAGA
jgi:hypothetical protein